jgi:hypothetical protein
MTNWALYTSPSGIPSGLQCVTTWRGTEAGTGPLGVFWAGTDGTLWRSSTDPHSDFVQMHTDATTVTRIGVDDRETIYGINSSGKPVQFGNDSWVSVDLGAGSAEYVMVDVAVALDDTAWYVAQGGQYYVHETSATIEKELWLSLKAIAPMKAPDSSDPSSEGEAWGVIKWGGGASQLAYNAGDAWVYSNGTREMISDVAAVSTSVSYAWLLKTDGSVWATISGYDGNRVGSSFTAKSICGGQGDYCFAVGTDGKPYRTTDPNPLA